MVNVSWRLWGRRKGLNKINSHCDIKDANPFEKYDRQYESKQEKIVELDAKIRAKEDEFIEKLKLGHIESSSKRNLKEYIKTLKNQRHLILTEIDCIAKNWDTAMRKWLRSGPPKKSGRKSKSAVVFKSARELKNKTPEFESINASEDEADVEMTEEEALSPNDKKTCDNVADHEVLVLDVDENDNISKMSQKDVLVKMVLMKIMLTYC